MAEILGTCDEEFSAVADALAATIDSGSDVGASVAVIKDGEYVVDIWAGDMVGLDGETRPWERDTIVNVYSTTKTMTNLSCLILADRGLVDLDAPVATYWPEFAANGKEGVLVRHLLGHTAGLPGWDEPMETSDLYDWDKCCARLAAQAPWWEPGTISGYHAITQGYLVGEVVRRVTGKSLGTFFREELAEPLGADFHISTPAECDRRVSRMVPPETKGGIGSGADTDSVMYRIWSNPAAGPENSWSEGWRRAEIPAANGHGNARSVARVQSIVSHGGEVDGHRYISEAGLERIFEQQTFGEPDLGIGMALDLGIGYGLISPRLPLGMTNKGCFWAGLGGSMIVNDLENRMTIAYVMNKMQGRGTTGDMRGGRMVYAAYGMVIG